MSATCPNGHTSEWEDWCSVCGERLGAPSTSGASSTPPAGTSSPAPASAPTPDGPSCSNCGETAHADDAFCESCGYDFASGTLPVAVEALPDDEDQGGDSGRPAAAGSAPAITTPLLVTVSVDPEFFAATTADVELAIPDPAPDTTEITLNASRNLVGRHSESRGILPEIDVEALTQDPGVSSRHIMFERTQSGIWSFTDLGSTNGTYLSSDADADPVSAGTAFPIDDGLRLWLGAWTRLDFAIDTISTIDSDAS